MSMQNNHRLMTRNIPDQITHDFMKHFTSIPSEVNFVSFTDASPRIPSIV